MDKKRVRFTLVLGCVVVLMSARRALIVATDLSQIAPVEDVAALMMYCGLAAFSLTNIVLIAWTER